MAAMALPSLCVATFRNKTDNKPVAGCLPWPELQTRLTRHTVKPQGKPHKDDPHKDGPLWSPTRYRPDTVRGVANVESLSCFVADVDDGTPLNHLRQAWKGLAWCAASSWSNTPEQPKYRVTFPLARPVPAADWPAVHRKLALALFGEHTDPACKDASRIYFLPSCPKISEVYAFADAQEGDPLDPDAYPDLDPMDAASAQMRYTLHAERPRMVGEERSTDKRHGDTEGARPGDDYNARGPVLELLQSAGWQIVGQRGSAAVLRRPGKTADWSANFGFGEAYDGRMFFCFTSSAPPFEPKTGYSPFAVYTLLKTGGDSQENFAEAARQLGRAGYGDQTPPGVKRALRTVAAEPETETAPPPSDADAPPTEKPRPASFQLTDDGNGLRLVHRHGDDLRYCYAWKQWLVWDGRRWKRDDGDGIEMRAKETARALLHEAGDCVDPNEQKALASHALKMQSYPRLQAMIAYARSEVPTRAEEWDTDRWLLNCPNGTVDLRTGQLRPHDRTDRNTKITGADFDPDARAPGWEGFLESILPSADVRAFVQRAAGYALTGDVSEQCLFFLYGHGSNGKSTLLRTLMDALGDYAMQAAPDLLIAKEGASGGPNNDVAELQGARFVATVEVEDGKRMAEGLVKQITGGDVIKARFMRENFFAFTPTHKIFLAANHKPAIRGQDFAIWRRIKVVPFEQQFKDAEDALPGEQLKDKDLPDKLRDELPGILAWAVRGCQEWRRKGLGEPEAVKAATAEYREEQDALRDFLNDCCVLRPSLTVSAGGLYKAYGDWCEQNGERALGKKTFTQRLREQNGIEPAAKVPPTWARGFVGIALRTDQPDAPSCVSDTSDAVSPMNGLYSKPRVDTLKNTSEVSERAVRETDAEEITEVEV